MLFRFKASGKDQEVIYTLADNEKFCNGVVYIESENTNISKRETPQEFKIVEEGKYINILNDLKAILNKKGRNKKGYDVKKHFVALLQKLNNLFGVKISHDYLYSLIDNPEMTREQRKQKIRDLTRGLNKKYEVRFFKELEKVKYNREIIIYDHDTNKPLYNKDLEPLRDNDNLSIAKAINTNCKPFLRDVVGYNLLSNEEIRVLYGKYKNTTENETLFYLDEEDNFFKELELNRQLKHEGHNKQGSVYIKDVKLKKIGKEFIMNKSRGFNMIEI